MAPIYMAESRWPIKIISTNPNNGMVMLLIMFGMASLSIDLFTSNSFFTNIQKMNVFFVVITLFCVENNIQCGVEKCGKILHYSTLHI